MRFSFCQQLIHERGLFVRQVFIPYEQSLGQFWRVGYGSGRQDCTQVTSLFEAHAAHPRAHPPLLRYGLRRTQSVGFTLLEYHTPHIALLSVYAWHIVQKIRLKTWAGRRYRQSLPTRGQRTRSNARSVRRGHAALVAQVFELSRYRILTRARRVAPVVLKKGAKRAGPKGKAKQPTKKGGPAKKKKLDVWR
jgi:hypothetical protein